MSDSPGPPDRAPVPGGGALLVLPGGRSRSEVVEARWLAAANLAGALATRLTGGAAVMTDEGILSPDQVRARAIGSTDRSGGVVRAARRIPRTVRVLLADARSVAEARRRAREAGRFDGPPPALVVQMHRRLRREGLILARRFGAPFVLRVEALEVQEEAGWGVHRPLWGRSLERRGEVALLRQADLCASVSEAVDEQVREAGVPSARRLVLSNGVDLELFSPGDPDPEIRRAHGLDGRFVVGWVGGFRPYHGLEMIPEIARRLRELIPNSVLCLVGTGPLRPALERSLEGAGDAVRLLPPVAATDVPRWVRSFDVCLLLASSSRFHYSPLKLYEYLACGRPVVAPAVGEPGSVLHDGGDALLVPPGDANAVGMAVERLSAYPSLAGSLGDRARRTAERLGSWASRADTLLQTLGERAPHPALRGRG